jgi:hypothetical protein
MADEDRKKSPMFPLKNIPLFKSVKIKLKSADSVSDGTGKYGKWYLWVGEVENQTVTEGRGADAKTIENYTGEIVFFPTEKLHEKLKATTSGKVDVEVSITKEAKEGPRGLIKEYTIVKVSEGVAPQSSMTPSEMKLLEDFETLQKEGITATETDFINASKDDKYGQISEERAKQLFRYFK